LEKAVVLVDIDTVGVSSLPDLKEGGNIPVALTSKSIPGYTIKLVSLGFYDVLQKPIDEERLRRLLQRLNGSQKVQRIIYIHRQEEEISGELCKELCSIVGNPEGKMREVLLKVGKAASLDVPVLFVGETGVGKEVFAKALWKTSRRWNGPFVAINCSAVPSELLEAELFGYERGAFTGAISSKEGLIESAKGGVLFLDEIGDLPLHLQPKLLRVLQEKK
jgi:transcriptional regulator with PAS, ATPase and Fis domain